MENDQPTSKVKFPHRKDGQEEQRTFRENGKIYERFGETIRFLTLEELQRLFDAMTRYEHKLLFRLAYEMGCRVGELVRIQVKHLDLLNGGVFIPAENTKTRQKRTSFVSPGLMNELADWLRRRNLLRRSNGILRHGDVYLFRSRIRPRGHITENRVRQVFRAYARRAGLEREYGKDSRGRSLHQLTVHSLRHSHCMHYIHIYKTSVPIVQRQVGHRTLQATMVYCRPTLEMVKEAYGSARTGRETTSSGASTAPPSMPAWSPASRLSRKS